MRFSQKQKLKRYAGLTIVIMIILALVCFGGYDIYKTAVLKTKAYHICEKNGHKFVELNKNNDYFLCRDGKNLSVYVLSDIQ